MVYEVIVEGDPDNTKIPFSLSAIWVLATLEIVVRDDTNRAGLLLQLASYTLNDPLAPQHGEGYWAPPNVAYPVEMGFSPPSTVWSLRRAIRDAVEEDRMQVDLSQLAYSMGLRDTRLEYRGRFIELKISPRTPGAVKAYCVVRYGLTGVDDGCLRNLADPEGRRGLIFYPLTTEGELPGELRRSDQHERDELWYLGKPVMSNVQRLLTEPAARRSLTASQISVPSSLFALEDTGIICVADLAGYGSALRYAHDNMHAFPVSVDQIELFFRRTVASQLENMLAALGTTQAQLAGDGFLSAYPDRLGVSRRDRIARTLRQWSLVVDRVTELNTHIRDDRYKIGSRLALHAGGYCYGRTGLISSFAAAFDGANIIEAARLEQALGSAMRNHRMVIDAPTDSGGEATLKARGHYVVVSPKLLEETPDALEDLGSGWSKVGTVDVSAKEYSTKALVLEYLNDGT